MFLLWTFHEVNCFTFVLKQNIWLNIIVLDNFSTQNCRNSSENIKITVFISSNFKGKNKGRFSQNKDNLS